MSIPFGIVQEPFFHLEYPIPALFGQFGFVVGHEMVTIFAINVNISKNYRAMLLTTMELNLITKADM